MVLRKSFYIRWSAGRSPRVHEVNPGRDPSTFLNPNDGSKIFTSCPNDVQSVLNSNLPSLLSLDLKSVQ